MATKTLADKVLKNFSIVMIKKTCIKVPNIEVRKKVVQKPKKDNVPVSAIVNILIKNAVDNTKREKSRKDAKKQKTAFSSDEEESKSYTKLKEDRHILVNSGYGTISKDYGIAPNGAYVDYEKLFSYLGKFKSQNPYEQASDWDINAVMDSSNKFSLIDKETMEKGARYIKYFKSPVVDLDRTSLVPITGMSSAEWEEFKRLMMLDSAMYRLKTSTS